MTDLPAPVRPIRFDVFELRPATGELYKSGRRLKLKPQAARVLVLLASRPGDAISREELCRSLWGAETHVDFERSLNSCVTQIRGALGDDPLAPRFVETLPRHGYRFIGTLEVAREPPPAPGRARSVRGRVVAVAGAVIATLVAASLVWSFRPRSDAPSNNRKMLLVRPFENLSGDAREDYFGYGLTEEIISDTAAIAPDRLGVFARSTAMRFAGTAVDSAAIAKELDCDYVLEGSFRREQDRIRITARLVSARDRTSLWSETFDRSGVEALALQTEVASRIARALLLEAEGVRPDVGSTEVAAAHEAYLRGRNELAELSDSGLERAIGSFTRAVELDPGYARAWAGLADAFNLSSWFRAGPTEESSIRARAAAERALTLAPDLAEAQDAMGFLSFYRDFDFPEAEARFRKALELSPGLAMTHYWYAGLLSATGRHDAAIASIRRAQELDPLSPLVNADAGWYYFYARRYDDAVRECRRVVAAQPDDAWARLCIVTAEAAAGREREALAELSVYAGLIGAKPSVRLEVDSATTLADARRAVARWLLDDRAPALAVSPYSVSILKLALDDEPGAVDALERAYRERDGFLVHAAVDPRLDPLRGNPRFEKLLARLGLDLGVGLDAPGDSKRGLVPQSSASRPVSR
jgi:TolB-like protein/DNA-binding winged helix-turn-helix (wHTH) protein/Tfp pilus assembly protein PilF